MTMMNPASSSSSDDDSLSSSSTEGILNDGKTPPRKNDGPEPADSDKSSSDAEEECDARHVSNFDELPTDDSEDESDRDSDDDSSGGQNEERCEDEIEEDIPLSERVASRALAGRRYYVGQEKATGDQGQAALGEEYNGKKLRAERKNNAIELASRRLREARKTKRGSLKQGKHKSKYGGESSDDNSVERGSSDDRGDPERERKRKKSKHAPTEISSKRRDYFSRGRPDLNSSGIGVSIGANKYKARDPRMVSLSGHLDADTFEKRYGFLDEVQEKEIEQLKRRVSAWKQSGKKGKKKRRKLGLTQGGGSLEEDEEELTRLLQGRAERKRADVVRAAKRSVKQKIRDDVASGKRGAYYPKRSELKRMEAEAKYNEIRKVGGDEAVDKAIAKRRKKNVSKASKQMPFHMVS
ncbi:hypothetical protein ACHAWF_003054 [Thalassiosira exigua]